MIKSVQRTFSEEEQSLNWLPSLAPLSSQKYRKIYYNKIYAKRLSRLIKTKLHEFNIQVNILKVHSGPVVTRVDLELVSDVKASKVINISPDLARSMSITSLRVVQIASGKPYVSIEVPNRSREMVRLLTLIDTPIHNDALTQIIIAIGKDITGVPVLTDLAKIQHMLVGGRINAEKTMLLHSMLISMLLKYSPQQLRLILIDPISRNLDSYHDIPHLLNPIITSRKDAMSALNWLIYEVEQRYKLMKSVQVRHISDFNYLVNEALMSGNPLPESIAQPLPSIVCIVSELADLVKQIGSEAEALIIRLVQKSHATGIYVILATDCPTTDVITPLIKTNIPARVALRVNTKVDSRTILGMSGAEILLEKADMLFMDPNKNELQRVHGAFISNDEINRVCNAWRERSSSNYKKDILILSRLM